MAKASVKIAQATTWITGEPVRFSISLEFPLMSAIQKYYGFMGFKAFKSSALLFIEITSLRKLSESWVTFKIIIRNIVPNVKLKKEL